MWKIAIRGGNCSECSDNLKNQWINWTELFLITQNGKCPPGLGYPLMLVPNVRCLILNKG